MPCRPTIEDHCCWVDGAVCPFFDAQTPDTIYRCTLRSELGSWRAVHSDRRYLDTVKPIWARKGIADCGDWTPDGTCASCGWDGS